MLTFYVVSEALTEISESLITSGMNMTIGSSGGVVINNVVGGVESVNIMEVKGMKIRGRETATNSFDVVEGWRKSELWL